MEKTLHNSKFNKEIIQKTLEYLLIILFIYASLNKISDMGKFQYELGKSPLIPFGYNKIFAYLIICIELSIAALISYKKTRKIGFLFSFSLMFFFTIYIYYLLNFSYYIPCSCGGILDNLTWEWHIIFNATFTIIAFISYYKYNEN